MKYFIVKSCNSENQGTSWEMEDMGWRFKMPMKTLQVEGIMSKVLKPLQKKKTLKRTKKKGKPTPRVEAMRKVSAPIVWNREQTLCV